MGGGGSGTGGGAGAGSGYYQYLFLQVAAGTVLTVSVGDQRQASSVDISSGDAVTAQPGQDGQGIELLKINRRSCTITEKALV